MLIVAAVVGLLVPNDCRLHASMFRKDFHSAAPVPDKK
jgi:hypothetical protein